MGAGASIKPTDSSRTAFISKIEGSARWALPFVLSGGQQPGERGSRPCPACGRATSRPPLRPAGRHPAHPERRLCRRPPRPAPCGVWPGKCAAQGRASPARSSWAAAVARGHPSAMQGQAPAGRADGPALHCSSPVPVAAQVLRGGPAPTSGGCGAVRPSGPVGGAAASRASPATPAAQAVPPGSAYALAARRSGPGPLAGGAAPQPSRGPGFGLLCSPCPCGGPQFTRRPLGPRKRGLCPLCGRLGRGERRLRAGMPPGSPAGKAKASPAQGGRSRPQAGALPASEPGSGGKRGGCPGLCRYSRPILTHPLGGASMFAVAFRFPGCPLPLWLVSSPGSAVPLWLSLSRSNRAVWPTAPDAARAARVALACPACCASAVGAPRWAVVRV